MATRRWLVLILALVLLNVSVAFENVWPTLRVELTTAVSVELAVGVLLLVLLRRWTSAHARTMVRGMAGLWVVLVVGRYADVTTQSLYGRDVNLYWDLQHVPNVGAMFAAVADPVLLATVIGGVVLVPILLFVGARWAFSRIGQAAGDPMARRVLAASAVLVLLLGLGQGVGVRVPAALRVAEPVMPAYARELGELVYEMSGAGVRALPPAPDMSSSLAGVAGADVFLIFMESYGAVTWERPEFRAELAESRARLEMAIRETGRGVVSALVESTTFGGESWLAHISLLAGTEVRDQGTNVRLMAQDRDTLVKVFGRHGYRTVAVMPGLQRSWPEGAFFGFDDIYDLARLDYRGPPFGWWDLNDQFALARVDALEVAPQPRAPVFVFFPTITTHAPFVPTPPYQSDWSRLLTTTPYDAAELDRAWADYPDWLNLGPSYLKALRYAHATIGGYLRLRADRDLVMVLVGDHQPPALVSGEGASWDVPVHVIANRTGMLDRLIQSRFSEGLTPKGPAIARMDTLLQVLLDGFGGAEAMPISSDAARSAEPS